MTDVVILGGGPTGLTAALQLARAGRSCTLLEAAPSVGGMAGSFEVAGMRVDHGSHRLHPATPAPLLALIGELLGDDLQVRRRSGRLRLAGRWLDFPLRSWQLLRRLPPLLSGRLAAESIRQSAGDWLPGGNGTSRSFADEVTRRFGPTVTGRFYGPYARKLYGVPADELDAELARRRISARSPADIARRLIGATDTDARTFLYPRRGFGQIADALAEAATAAGADIRLRCPARSISLRAGGASIGTGAGTIDAPVVLSTLSPRVLAGLVDPGPGEVVCTALDQLRVRAMVLVYLVLDRPRYTPFDAHYLPDPEVRVSRLSEPKNYRDGDDPGEVTVLCAELPCWVGDDLWRASPDELVALVVDDLRRVDLPEAAPVAVTVKRLPSVYPVYDLAGREARATVGRWTASLPNVVTLGRQGLLAIDNLHHVMAMAVAAVDSLGPDGVVDADRWRAELERFATNVVED